MALTGQCLCGQVKYSAASLPLATLVCHCRNCQKQSWSAFSIIVAVPSSQFTINGDLKTFVDTADSGKQLKRQFCFECGSPMFSVPEDNPGITVIKAGTLDDTQSVKPQANIWCDSAQEWLAIDTSLPCFRRNMPE